MPESPEPRADTAPGVHEKVLDLLKNEGRSRILDMGSWEGALSLSLEKMGFQVFACDIANQMKVAHIPWQQWDLNSNAFPYEDGFFDCVACVEVIEHLENPHHLLRQVGRLLRQGGKVIITTPNIVSLWSRLRFLLTGRFAMFPPEDLTHSNPIPFWELERALRQNGFTVEQITTNQHDKLSRLLWPLTYFLVRPRALLGGNVLIIKAVKG